jgi:hypothetical protein
VAGRPLQAPESFLLKNIAGEQPDELPASREAAAPMDVLIRVGSSTNIVTRCDFVDFVNRASFNITLSNVLGFRTQQALKRRS